MEREQKLKRVRVIALRVSILVASIAVLICILGHILGAIAYPGQAQCALIVGGENCDGKIVVNQSTCISEDIGVGSGPCCFEGIWCNDKPDQLWTTSSPCPVTTHCECITSGARVCKGKTSVSCGNQTFVKAECRQYAGVYCNDLPGCAAFNHTVDSCSGQTDQAEGGCVQLGL
jgi:hypothetical protein